MPRQAVSLKANSLAGVAEFGDVLHPGAEIKADDRRGDDAEREQPLENPRAFAAIRRRQAFGQIQRHHHADQSAADALQQAPENQRAIAVRQAQ